VDLGRRSRRSVTRARKVREEGDGADRRARGLSESDARGRGEALAGGPASRGVDAELGAALDRAEASALR